MLSIIKIKQISAIVNRNTVNSLLEHNVDKHTISFKHFAQNWITRIRRKYRMCENWGEVSQDRVQMMKVE